MTNFLRPYRGFVSSAVLLISLAFVGCRSSSESVTRMHSGLSDAVGDATTVERPRNIILFISDGCGPASFTLARDFLRTERGVSQLSLDGILVGSVQTFSSDALITDSASSATAYACGVKTRNGMIGMGPDSTVLRSVTDVAKAAGMHTGLVATSRITHATPASFVAHVTNRGMEAEIAAQMIASGVDLMLGGGRRFFVPTDAGGSRSDSRDLLVEARTKGFAIVETKTSLMRLNHLPALGLFADDHLPYEIDRDVDAVPSLQDLTTAALNILSADDSGFFLMVEGSRIDHAAHVNDLGGHLYDVIAYDDAVKAGLDFAKRNGETLLISVSDHETGGLTVGRSVDGRSMYTWRPAVAAGLTGSNDAILGAIYDDGVQPAEAIRRFTGIDDLTADELSAMSVASRSSANFVLGDIVGRRALIGWTTGGHTAVDVNLYAFGPGSQAFHGHLDNADIGAELIRLLE